MARSVPTTEEEEESIRAAAREANERAEQEARRKRKGRGAAAPVAEEEPEESDFIEGADLGGKHQPRGVAMFWLEINGSLWGCREVDSGCHNRIAKANEQAGKQQGKLLREQARLEQQAEALSARFVAALKGEDEEEATPEDVEALIEAHEDSLVENQRAQAEIIRSPLKAMLEVASHCLVDWKHKDGVPFNADTVAALSETRTLELGTLCWQRRMQGGAARFRR